jgi:hypothetical protein
MYLLGESYPSGLVTLSDIPIAITQIIGGVSTDIGDGHLSRELPLAHPFFPWLYASGTPTIKGFGQGYQANSLPTLEAAPFPQFTAYPNYEFDVGFESRPYVIAGDSSVPKVNLDFYDTLGGHQTTFQAAAEWVRYTDWWYERKFDSITCRQGFFALRSQIATFNGQTSVPFADMPRLFLPDSLLKIVWYQVPYRYITSTNSYIDGLVGTINQNDFTNWKVGKLLYIGYTAHRYTPPVQRIDQVFTGSSGFIFSAEKWCDVEFLFLYTRRKLSTSGELLNNIGNPNNVQAGWNLLPWMVDRNFHYGTTVGPNPDTDPTKWRPLFQSAEFALLFTDPDAQGVFQVANL